VRKSVMRTFEGTLRALLVGGLLAAAPAHALDGSKTDPSVGPPPMSPMEAFRSGANWLKAGETVKAVNSLEYAAEKGHALAQWKLGRMYAEGDGVAQNDLKAFEYFRRIADSHADDNPDTPQARFVANAFVALGHYYLEGIPKTEVRSDPQRAREMFNYAIRMRSIIWPGFISTAPARHATRVRRRDGSVSRRRKANAKRRRCSAPCCSKAIMCRVRPRAV